MDGAQGDYNDEYSSVEAEWAFDIPGNLAQGRRLVVSVRGNAVPEIVTDRPDLITIDNRGKYHGVTTGWEATPGVTEYLWTLSPAYVGSGHIYCKLNGITVLSSAFSCSEPPVEFLNLDVMEINTDRELDNTSENECYPGEIYAFHFFVQAIALPELSTDNPAVVKFSPAEMDDSGSRFVQSGTVCAEIIGTGDANITVTLKGSVYWTFAIHAVNQ